MRSAPRRISRLLRKPCVICAEKPQRGLPSNALDLKRYEIVRVLLPYSEDQEVELRDMLNERSGLFTD